MRYLAVLSLALCCAAPAAAARPGFAVFDLHDLAKASKDHFGDVKVTAGRPAARFVVRCADGCRFGSGWLGFTRTSGVSARQVRSASAAPGLIGWSLRLALTARGKSAWAAYARLAARRQHAAGVPDVLAVVVGGRVLATPFANQVRLSRSGLLTLPGFTRAEARAAVRSLPG